MANLPKIFQKHNAFALPADMLAASASLDAALAARAKIDDAITRNALARLTAQEAARVAEADVEKIELELALETDPATVARLDAASAAATAIATTATTAALRADKTRAGLYLQAVAADVTINEAKAVFANQLGLYGNQVNAALHEEATVAAQYLAKVLARGYAANEAIRCLSASAGFLGDTKVASPSYPNPDIIGNGKVYTQTGERHDLTDWQSDPQAAELSALMAPLAELRRRAASHTAFTPPPKPQQPYVIKGS